MQNDIQGLEHIRPPHGIKIASLNPSLYLETFRKCKPIKYKKEYYFIERILHDGLFLIKIDKAVLEIMKRVKERRLQIWKEMDKRNRFWCSYCNEVRPKAGRVQGKISLVSTSWVCARCKKHHELTLFEDRVTKY